MNVSYFHRKFHGGFLVTASSGCCWLHPGTNVSKYEMYVYIITWFSGTSLLVCLCRPPSRRLEVDLQCVATEL